MTVEESLISNEAIGSALFSLNTTCTTYCGKCKSDALNPSCPIGKFRERLRGIAEERKVPWAKIETMTISFGVKIGGH